MSFARCDGESVAKCCAVLGGSRDSRRDTLFEHSLYIYNISLFFSLSILSHRAPLNFYFLFVVDWSL